MEVVAILGKEGKEGGVGKQQGSKNSSRPGALPTAERLRHRGCQWKSLKQRQMKMEEVNEQKGVRKAVFRKGDINKEKERLEKEGFLDKTFQVIRLSFQNKVFCGVEVTN